MSGQFPLGDINPYKYFFGIAFIVGVIFSFISSNNDELFVLLFLQWQLQSLIPMGLLIGSHLLLSRLHAFTHLVPWQQVVISGIVGATLFTPVALFIDIFYVGEGWPQHFLIEILDEWVGVVFPVVIVWLLLNLPWLSGMQFVNRQVVEQVNDNQPYSKKDDKANYPFMQLIQNEFQGEVLSMSSQLHYIDVVTSKGHQLILYSLKEAIEEISTVKGMQIHRSHWVAYDAIESIKKNGRQGTVLLKNGQQVPVSRAYFAQLLENVSN